MGCGVREPHGTASVPLCEGEEGRSCPAPSTLRPAPCAHPSLRGHPSFCKTHEGTQALAPWIDFNGSRDFGEGGEEVHQCLLLPGPGERVPGWLGWDSEGCQTYPGGQQGPAARALCTWSGSSSACQTAWKSISQHWHAWRHEYIALLAK